MTSPSGWCSPDCSPRFHIKCQDRIDKGQLEWCVCEARGGHTARVKDPELVALTPTNWDNGTSPQGAQTPAGSDHPSLPKNERG